MSMPSQTTLARKPRSASQTGASLVELAMVMPLLLAAILAVSEIGSAVREYLRLFDAVQAGLRSAQAYAELEPRPVGYRTAHLSGDPQCHIGLENPDDRSNHEVIHGRVNRILCNYGTRLEDVKITSGYIEGVANGTPKGEVFIRVEGLFRSSFVVIPPIPVSAEASAPFLSGS